ncbi:glycogen debranching N-terminal domain-containing protein [Nocardioides sp. AN3]
MSDPWLFTGAPETRGGTAVTLMEGTTFCISDPHGDVGTQAVDGLFVRDTRVLSAWRLRLVDRRLGQLTVAVESAHEATFHLLSTSSLDHGTSVVVSRRRQVGEGLREDLTIRNGGPQPAHLDLVLEADTDFADLVEVKEGRVRPTVTTSSAVAGTLALHARRDGEDFQVAIKTDGHADPHARAIAWTVDVPARGSWRSSVLVQPVLRGKSLETPFPRDSPPEQATPAVRRRQFRSNAPGLWTADRRLADALGRSIEDLATLRIFDPDRPELPVVAAGAPWFMALFGRDSLLTSIMLLPVDASLALGTVTALGLHQGVRDDDLTEEQPGRILHELRFGPAGSLALGGRPAYYGSADATPLFVMTVGELFRWCPSAVTPALLDQVDRALEWIVGAGDADGDGFVESESSNGRGLANQGWKDSWDGVNFANGTIASPPIALAEVQAYVYGAFVARAEIADGLGDVRTAATWRDRAARLWSAFDEAFWLPDQEWYAVGLDRDKRPIDALTSNIGHCLWTGIADPLKATVVAQHLSSPEMFSGWGVRTLGVSMGAYDPLSYHNGSVWPHDTAICVAGLARYGHVEEARRLTLGLLDASTHFGHRLPDLFAGFAREEMSVPVPYPAACSPRAWAAAAPIELVRALLALQPDGETPTCRPALPEQFLPFRLTNIAYRDQHYDVVVGASGWTIRPANRRG